MNQEILESYNHIRSGGTGFYEQKRGLIAVWGKEAVQFLDGLITNDMKTLADGAQMLAAFPNAQGRLVAVVCVLRQGDRFLFETEDATREKLYANLFRFTYAGDFFVEDLSDKYCYLEVQGPKSKVQSLLIGEEIVFEGRGSRDHFVPIESVDVFRNAIVSSGAVEISDELHETLRIENGTPKYGFDMDETTIVPELGLDGLISYNKGCYIGQEIIARIHFRGHVAKRLAGLVFDETPPSVSATNADKDVRVPSTDKNAGSITSVTFSPKLDKTIALAYVRYAHLAAGTELATGDVKAVVSELPFIQ